MKAKRVKLAALILVCALMISAAAGIAIAANETAPAIATIGSKNIAFGDGINLAFRLDLAESEDGVLGLAVWEKNDDGVYTFDNVKHITWNTYTEEGGTETFVYAFSNGIAPKNVKTTYVYAPIVYDEYTGVTEIGETLEYSVEAYIEEMRPTASEDQLKMYEKLLAYADIAADRLPVDVAPVEPAPEEPVPEEPAPVE